MENSLLIRTDAAFSLNFLIYIQNIFLNKKLSDEELRFPYIFTEVNFEEDFELCYRTLWNEVAQRISDDPLNDLKIFHEEKDLFYHSLFTESNENLKDFNTIYQSFKIWWNSFAGRFSIERSVDEKGEKLYLEVANALVQKRIKPQKELNISLIYDECLLADSKVSSYFVVVSLKDIFVKFKETVSKIQMRIK